MISPRTPLLYLLPLLALWACDSPQRRTLTRASHALGPMPEAACGSLTYEGCCDGQTVWYCESSKLKSVSCAKNLSCGWDPMTGVYDCGTRGGADPSAKHPQSCGPHFGDAGPPASDGGRDAANDANNDASREAGVDAAPGDSGGDAGPSCLGVPLEGCCHGSMLYYCSGGRLLQLSCAKDPACGWSSTRNWYTCGTAGGSDPGGKLLRACSALWGDAGIPLPDASLPDTTPAAPDLLAPPDQSLAPDSAPALDRGTDARDSAPADSLKPDSGTTTPPDEGCSCAAAPAAPPWPALLLWLALALGRVTISHNRKRHDP